MSTLVESRSPFSQFMPKETCSFNYFNSSTANSKILTDYNNNMSPKNSMVNNCMAYPSKGPSATIKIISPPQTVQQNPDSLTLSLGTASANEVASCLSAVINSHPKLDRSMSEPVERSQQTTGRSNSFTSGTICNSTNNISGSSRYKTELCRPYEEHGVCKYGDKCQFAHGVHELRGMVRHPKYKTELCRTYHSSGFCPYGPRCHFIHNSDERKRSKSYSPESSSGETSPEDIFPNQKMFFNEDTYSKPPSPPYDAATLSESFTFDHHNYQQSGNSIQQLNNTFSNCSQITFRNSRIAAALLAQQQNRLGSLINDDDVFVQGMDTKETLDETVRRLALMRLGVSVPGSNGSYPFFNSYQLASD